jgi:transcription elongation factor Elf1
MRCPICNDSSKSKTKARGYIYKKKNHLFYKCHNCNIGLSFGNFLKTINAQLYNEYTLEVYVQKKERKETKQLIKLEKPKTPTIDLGLKSLKDLSAEHVAVKYVRERKIPKQHYDKLFYTDDFQSWAEEKTNGEYKNKYISETSDPRIVIPFFDANNNLIAVQGRSLVPGQLRYVTIKFDENAPKIYGLERWISKKISFLVEGPLDSLFLPNALASADSNLTSCLEKISCNKNKIILIADNESRNLEICHQMKKSIESEYRVVIWPETVKEKDINDMVLAGRNVLKIIRDNVYKGAEALIKFNQWKKC